MRPGLLSPGGTTCDRLRDDAIGVLAVIRVRACGGPRRSTESEAGQRVGHLEVYERLAEQRPDDQVRSPVRLRSDRTTSARKG